MTPTLKIFLNQTGMLNASIAEHIAENFRPVSFLKSEFFLREKKVADQYLFLETGFMRAFVIDINGEEVTTGLYVSNQVVFEVNSFFNRVPSIENIQCLSDCQGWVLSFQELNMLFHTIPEFREFGRSILVKSFTRLKTRMLSMITETAEQRYMSLLESHPQALQVVPLKYIASYLGITDTSLSRIRKEITQK